MAAAEVKVPKKAAATKIAKEFCAVYYDFFDKNRHELQNLYESQARLKWNSTSKTGIEAIMGFFNRLDLSATSVHSVTVQVLCDVIWVTVTGERVSVNYRPRLFTQQFLLSLEGEAPKIWRDILRWRD